MWRVLEGDCRTVLAGLEPGSVHACVTSPPYFGLRDYGHGGQIGLEPTPDEFVAAVVGVFREVRRVLRDDGTVWLNLGDSFHGAGYANHRINGEEWLQAHGGDRRRSRLQDRINASPHLKPKDLIGIPWMVAFALRADGWYLRSDIIWSRPNPMPESVTDRPTKSHEYVFLLSKRPRYFYDADAIREANEHPDRTGTNPRLALSTQPGNTFQIRDGERDGIESNPAGRNKRSVWTVATQPYPGAHFATFPPKLIEPCILAGCPERACSVCGAPWTRVVEREQGDSEAHGRPKRTAGMDSRTSTLSLSGGSKEWAERGGKTRTVGWEPSCAHDAPTVPGTVLDPFAGAGTTGVVALRHDRSFVGIELNPEYVELARRRIVDDAPLLNSVLERSADPAATITP
jgi:DNA modification methylase